MNHFREMVTERVAEAPRSTRATETRMPVSPVPARAAEPQVRREEVQAAIRHEAEERVVLPKKPEIDQPHPLQEPRTKNDSAPEAPPTIARSIRPEIRQEPTEARVPIPREVIRDVAQPQQEPPRAAVQIDVPVAVPSAAPQFPALKPDRPERHTPVTKIEPQIRSREFPVAPALAPYAQPAVILNEIAAPSIHVTIGKVTVQATLLAAPVHAPARVPAHTGPRLTLERYLDRRGGRL